MAKMDIRYSEKQVWREETWAVFKEQKKLIAKISVGTQDDSVFVRHLKSVKM